MSTDTETHSRGRKFCVFAAHVDDEMIGCWELIELQQVAMIVYFFELSEARIAEAKRLGKEKGIEIVLAAEVRPLKVPEGLTIVAPHILDLHPHHKLVNGYAKVFHKTREMLYYSVDMNTRGRKTLSPEAAAQKLYDLLYYYPSQKELFMSDAKYHLFEALEMSDLTTTISISTQFEGIHAYPNAPEEVAFLRHPHRHIFHVDVEVDVFHDDREIEFIMFKREIELFIKDNMNDLQGSSCEMIGRQILMYVVTKYMGRSCKVHVSEDRENGATVKFKYAADN